MTLRPAFRLAAVLLSACCVPVAARAGGLAFVVDSSGAAVSLVDVDSRAEVKRIPLLREPHHMALTPDGKSLLVGDTAANTLFFLDPRTGDVQRRLTVSDPYQITFSPDGKWLTVAGLARNQIDIYDAATYELLHRIPAGTMPSHINYAPDSSVVYASLQGTDSLVAIEVRTGRVLWKKPVGKTPAGVLFHDGKLLVGIMGADYVAVVDPADGSVTGRIHTGRGAHVLFLSHDRRTIYVSNRVDSVLVALDAATLKEVRRYAVPGGPDDLDFGPDGRIWIAQRWQRNVAVMDPATGAIQQVDVGRSPHGIWLNTHMPAPAKVAAGG